MTRQTPAALAIQARRGSTSDESLLLALSLRSSNPPGYEEFLEEPAMILSACVIGRLKGKETNSSRLPQPCHTELIAFYDANLSLRYQEAGLFYQIHEAAAQEAALRPWFELSRYM